MSWLEHKRLRWIPQLGVGRYDVDPADWPYDRAYFDKYAAMAATPMGEKITAWRSGLVSSIAGKGATVLDVGIGCGQFLEAMPGAVGTDVNPAAIDWLVDHGRLWTGGDVDAVTFWDSLEHLDDFRPLVAKARRWVFVSTPIYRDAEHALTSKHFRPTEHFWYFTAKGLRDVMSQLGLGQFGEWSWETSLGRESIGTFAFHRYRTCNA